MLLPLVAVALFTGLVALSRSLRGLYHRVAGRLRRWMGPRAARALGWVTVVVVTWLVASGLLLNGLAALADRSFSVRNSATAEGVEPTTSPLRSGGPGSLVSWESLGRQGRTITGTGPSADEIAAWSGSEATEPIRAYAGTVSAEDVEERAELAVADLERAGGFDRGYLLVATTTGSGWLDSGAIDSFEYLTGGDSAIVAMQYSYLPSWLSYLVDQKKAREAGRELFDAVYDRWSKLSPADRPRLFVFGLSLGSLVARPPSAASTTCATGPSGHCSPARPTSTPSTGSSPTTATRAPLRWSRSTRMAEPFGSPTMWPPASRRPRPAGTGPGCCTCSTPRTRSSGGARA